MKAVINIQIKVNSKLNQVDYNIEKEKKVSLQKSLSYNYFNSDNVS